MRLCSAFPLIAEQLQLTLSRRVGRYAIVNQYLYYPLGCAVTSISASQLPWSAEGSVATLKLTVPFPLPTVWLAGYIPFVQSIFIEHARGASFPHPPKGIR